MNGVHGVDSDDDTSIQIPVDLKKVCDDCGFSSSNSSAIYMRFTFDESPVWIAQLQLAGLLAIDFTGRAAASLYFAPDCVSTSPHSSFCFKLTIEVAQGTPRDANSLCIRIGSILASVRMHVIDAGGARGTHINGVRLFPFFPHPLPIASDSQPQVTPFNVQSSITIDHATTTAVTVRIVVGSDENSLRFPMLHNSSVAVQTRIRLFADAATSTELAAPQHEVQISKSILKRKSDGRSSPRMHHPQVVPTQLLEVPNPCRSIVLLTTGFRLTASQAARVHSLGLTVITDFEKCAREGLPCTHIVVQAPLKRSVKLLCALPFASRVVSRDWLTELLDSGIPPRDGYDYREIATRNSIQVMNEFSIAELLVVPPENRQKLFDGMQFFVLPDVDPQQPNNDMKSVIVASGGAITQSRKFADVEVHAFRPQRVTSRRCISPEEIYRSVLQHRIVWLEEQTREPAPKRRRML